MLKPAEVSRRLKAARWLAGGVDAKGKPKELKVSELALRPPLPENGISANRLAEIEQLKITAPPMELEKIEEALGLPGWFFAESPVGASEEAVRRAGEMLGPLLLGAAQAIRQERELEPPSTDEPDRRSGAMGGDDV
jgi:hypothetical protein